MHTRPPPTRTITRLATGSAPATFTFDVSGRAEASHDPPAAAGHTVTKPAARASGAVTLRSTPGAPAGASPGRGTRAAAVWPAGIRPVGRVSTTRTGLAAVARSPEPVAK